MKAQLGARMPASAARLLPVAARGSTPLTLGFFSNAMGTMTSASQSNGGDSKNTLPRVWHGLRAGAGDRCGNLTPPTLWDSFMDDKSFPNSMAAPLPFSFFIIFWSKKRELPQA